MSSHVSLVRPRDEAKSPRSNVRPVEVSAVDGTDEVVRNGMGEEMGRETFRLKYSESRKRPRWKRKQSRLKCRKQLARRTSQANEKSTSMISHTALTGRGASIACGARPRMIATERSQASMLTPLL